MNLDDRIEAARRVRPSFDGPRFERVLARTVVLRERRVLRETLFRVGIVGITALAIFALLQRGSAAAASETTDSVASFTIESDAGYARD